MKKLLYILMLTLPLLSNAQKSLGISVSGSYGKSASFGIGITSQRLIGNVVGFNADYKGATAINALLGYYKTGKIRYSFLAGVNVNIKKSFTISANGGISYIEVVKQKVDNNQALYLGATKPCFEGLVGYNVIDKEKFVFNLRAGYNNHYGGILAVGILF